MRDLGRRAPAAPGGIPLEEAPLWVLALATLLVALAIFPALVGILAATGLAAGGSGTIAFAALALATLLVAGPATARPWRRRGHPDSLVLADSRPFLLRFSTWVWATLVVPNVIYGLIVLFHSGPPPDPRAAYLVGALVSLVQGSLALVARWRRRTPP